MENTEKPIHAKPSLYAFYFEVLKEIALKYGYNLVLHGSMNRDLDLIAIPWQEEIKPHTPMIKEMADCIGGYVMGEKGGLTKENFDAFKNRFHGRESWIININRGITAKYDGMVPDFKEHNDPQYYIDISVLPVLKPIDLPIEERQEEKTLLQEFYSLLKVNDIRDKVITGSFSIAENGVKEPSDWKQYALNLEEYIVNVAIKQSKI